MRRALLQTVQMPLDLTSTTALLGGPFVLRSCENWRLSRTAFAIVEHEARGMYMRAWRLKEVASPRSRALGLRNTPARPARTGDSVHASADSQHPKAPHPLRRCKREADLPKDVAVPALRAPRLSPSAGSVSQQATDGGCALLEEEGRVTLQHRDDVGEQRSILRHGLSLRRTDA